MTKRTIHHYTECPYCGSGAGYFTRDAYRVLINRVHTYDGDISTSTRKRVRDYIPGKRAYCIDCGHYIAPTRRTKGGKNNGKVRAHRRGIANLRKI